MIMKMRKDHHPTITALTLLLLHFLDATALPLTSPPPHLCQSATASASCSACTSLHGCGWSVVRKACYTAHPVATDHKCPGDNEGGETNSPSEWLEHARSLLDPTASAYGPQTLRAAFRALEKGAFAAARDETHGEVAVQIEATRVQLAGKLDAVFDDVDAQLLLNRTRHKLLEAVHPSIAMVPRLRLADARAFLERSEPVVITDLFLDEPNAVVHRWTLDYVHRMHMGGRLPSLHGKPQTGDILLNVASDLRQGCCRYHEPRRNSVAAGYPYPFAPRTHLYRDTFGGFVETLRTAAASKAAAATATQTPLSCSANATAPSTLHYLHDLVIEGGEPMLGGKKAPRALASDLRATVRHVAPATKLAPHFDVASSAKLWLGQQGIVM